MKRILRWCGEYGRDGVILLLVVSNCLGAAWAYRQELFNRETVAAFHERDHSLDELWEFNQNQVAIDEQQHFWNRVQESINESHARALNRLEAHGCGGEEI